MCQSEAARRAIDRSRRAHCVRRREQTTAGCGMERMFKKVGYRGREGGDRGRGRSADRRHGHAVSEDVILRKLLRVLPTPATACAEWMTMMEFTKRRFCGRKCDNELYRSNSFKFERFEGKEDGTSSLGLDLAPLRRQVGGFVYILYRSAD